MNLIGNILFIILFSVPVTNVSFYNSNIPVEQVNLEKNEIKNRDFNPEELNNILKIILKRHNLNDVIIDGTKTEKNYNLKITIYPKNRIKQITITGNRVFSKEKIATQLPSLEGNNWYTFLKKIIKTKLENFYKEHGRLQAKISINYVSNKGEIIIDINEGPPFWIINTKLDDGDNTLLKHFNTIVGKEYNKHEIDKEILILKQNLLKEGYIMPRLEYRICDTDNKIKTVSLCFILKKNNKIKLEFKGNSFFSSDELYFYLKLNKIKPLNMSDIDHFAKQIKKKYYKNGFPFVKVKTVKKTIDKDKLLIIFKINEGDKAWLKNIYFAGNNFFTDKILFSKLIFKPKNYLLKTIINVPYEPQLFKENLKAVKSFYMKNGFLDIKIDNELLSLTNNGLTVTIPVEEGKRFFLKEITIQGNKYFTNNKILNILALKLNSPVDPFKIENRTIELQKKYKNNGFINSSVVYSYKVSDESIQLNILIKENKQYRWNNIYINGNNKVTGKQFKKLISIKPGTPFSEEEYYNIYKILYNTRYFEKVKLSYVIFDCKLDLIISVTEKPSNSIDIAMAMGTEEGITLSSKFNTWYFFKGIRNLSLSLLTEYNYEKLYNLNTDYDKPDILSGTIVYKEPISYVNQLYLQDILNIEHNLNYRDFHYRKKAASIGLEKLFLPDISTTLSYNIENSEYFDITTPELWNSTNFLIGYLEFIFLRDKRNDIFVPTKGNYQNINFSYGNSFLFSDFNYFRYKLISGWFWELLSVKISLATRIGEIYSSSGIYLPETLKFYLGGDYSLRGYMKDSIKTFVKLGGAKLYTGGISFLNYQFDTNIPFYKNFEFVLFTDGGNVWNKNFYYINYTIFKFSAGYGIRYITPAGPLTFNIGYPLFREPGEAPYVFHFFIRTSL